MPIKSRIRTIPDFPKPGIMFRDITSLLQDAEGFKLTIDSLKERYQDKDIDVIVGIEARGFILGAALAYVLGKGFVPIRKKGKLPGKTLSQDYSLEYGTDTIEIHEDALQKGSKVLILDDLLATGGTVFGAISLVKQAGAVIQECAFVVDLPEIGGSKRLEEEGIPYFKLVDFEGH